MRILVVEDDRYLTEIIDYLFRREGHTIHLAKYGDQALELSVLHAPHVILVDLVPPSHEGLELCRRLHRICPAPIVVLSYSEREAETERLTQLGVVRVINKPFTFGELLTAVHEVGGPEEQAQATARFSGGFQVPPFTLDAQNLAVRLAGRSTPVPLSPVEAKLLYHLMQRAGQVTSIERLAAAIWKGAADPATLQTTFHYLQVKLEANPARPRYLVQREQGLVLIPQEKTVAAMPVDA